MQVLLDATYKKGSLVLSQKLDAEKEGKKFKVLLFDKESNKAKKARFLEFVEKQHFKLPEEYKFNRSELHE